MGDWIFHAILSMVVGGLGLLYFLKVFVLPPGTNLAELNGISGNYVIENQITPP